MGGCSWKEGNHLVNFNLFIQACTNKYTDLRDEKCATFDNKFSINGKNLTWQSAKDYKSMCFIVNYVITHLKHEHQMYTLSSTWNLNTVSYSIVL